MVESEHQVFARLMDEELSKLDKGPEDPLTRGEFLDALRAVHDRAPPEVRDNIYALAKAVVQGLKAPAS